MILPQELEVFYVIPAIRKELAVKLKANGLSQKKIAGIFGVTEACVSNYFKSKRANDVKFSPELKSMIDNCAKEISKGKSCFIS
ncbi:MAG TPA: transcriptional regulator, partial [Candidatus Nanoarchaeia archaeon]|nr:transcriptional regulator [Candidatus Nanoarchaeia archaeon]